MPPRQFISACVLAVALTPMLSAANPTPAQVAAESAKANAFFDRVFEESIARSPMSLAQLGLKKDNDQWDDLSDAHALEDLELSVQHFAELKRTIHFELLDDQAKVSYRMFVDDSERAIEGWKWRYYNYPLDQMSGLHSEAPALLINYHQIDTVNDARAYIARLRGMGRLFDQLIEGVRIRAEKNIIPPKFVFPLVIASSRDVISGEPFDHSGKKSALLNDFETKINGLKDKNDASKQQLIAEARAALIEVVKPAYENLISVLQEQEKTATTDDGVWKFAEGLTTTHSPSTPRLRPG